MKFLLIVGLLFLLLPGPRALWAQDLMDDTVEEAPVKPKAGKSAKAEKPAVPPTEDKEAVPLAPPGSMEDMPYAELQALDKITARVSHLQAKINDTVTFGSLNIIVKACRKALPEDAPEAASFLQVWEQKPGEDSHWVYSGWMFASSPALASMDHPVYDIWVTDCKKSLTSTPSAPAH